MSRCMMRRSTVSNPALRECQWAFRLLRLLLHKQLRCSAERWNNCRYNAAYQGRQDADGSQEPSRESWTHCQQVFEVRSSFVPILGEIALLRHWVKGIAEFCYSRLPCRICRNKYKREQHCEESPIKKECSDRDRSRVIYFIGIQRTSQSSNYYNATSDPLAATAPPRSAGPPAAPPPAPRLPEACGRRYPPRG
jgi:hypothetical protein